MKKKILIIVSIVVFLALCVVNATLINTKQLSIREETLQNKKIDKSFDNFVIAFFSDLYLDKADDQILDKTVNSINKYSPDVIIFGGDIAFNINSLNQENTIEKLASLNAKYGKYAVLGENDNEASKQILVSSGFKILDNNSVQLYLDKTNYINIVGLENMINGSPNISDAFNNVNSNHLVVSICHTPDIAYRMNNGKTDLLLSGHSLGGEIYLPIINNFTREKGAENYFHGIYNLGNTIVDVSNGVGLKNKSARLFADAEVVIYKLKAEVISD